MGCWHAAQVAIELANRPGGAGLLLLALHEPIVDDER